MTDHAYIQQDFAHDGLAVYLVRRYHDGRSALGQPVQLVMADPEPAEVAPIQAPTLRLPESMARALLDALAAHFGATSDVQTLRQDYLAERARVDKMINHLTSASHPRPPGPPIDTDHGRTP